MAIGRIRTHYALRLDAKARIAFRARRDCGSGGPIKHVALTLTEVARLSFEASTAWGGGSTPLLKPSASVPMFSRTEQQARERQVLARISSREAVPTAAEREIELKLWRATHGAAGKAETVRASRCLLDNADTAYNIAMARFTSSVGSALEMLSAQNALASANSSATQAEITALAARIRLSLASGRMQLAK